MPLNPQTLEEYLLSEKDNMIEQLKIIHKWMVRNLDRDSLIDESWEEGYAGLQVRLHVDAGDQNWQILTGDSQYDISHRGFWGFGLLDYDIASEDMHITITDLVEGLISGVLDEEAETTE
jgi:hypothetical protein